jgi:hypothetical protein
MDYRPSRMAVVAKHAEAFIREFFDQNPFSQSRASMFAAHNATSTFALIVIFTSI